ncbi:MAG: hypothetical protein R2698_01885 [Microthrixaceae bacterium]
MAEGAGIAGRVRGVLGLSATGNVASSRWSRAVVARLVGGRPSSTLRHRVDAAEAAASKAAADVAELRSLVEQLHRSLVQADPGFTREMVEAVRGDVAAMLARLAANDAD